MTQSILKENKSYRFSDYFELPNPTKDIVAEFGYQFKLQKLDLPTTTPINMEALEKLKKTFYQKLPHISLTSEAAKREFLISPLFFELLDYIEVDIDIEYPIHINEKLKGKIDYLIRSEQNFIVVEAKNADLEKGFSQLAVELIAMSQYLENAEQHHDLIYGAVTVGDIWRFGILDFKNKRIFKDIDAFLVPASIEALFSVFLGILGNKTTP
jgi:hypothetical protein